MLSACLHVPGYLSVPGPGPARPGGGAAACRSHPSQQLVTVSTRGRASVTQWRGNEMLGVIQGLCLFARAGWFTQFCK